MYRSDDYVKVKGVLETRTDGAFLVNFGDRSKEKLVWIPYSIIHAADEKKIQSAMINTAVEFRVREWKAERLGL